MMSLSRWVPTRFTSWPLSVRGKAIAEAMIPEPSTLTFVTFVLLQPFSERLSARVLLDGAGGKAPDQLLPGGPAHYHGHDYRQAREGGDPGPELSPRGLLGGDGDRERLPFDGRKRDAEKRLIPAADHTHNFAAPRFGMTGRVIYEPVASRTYLAAAT